MTTAALARPLRAALRRALRREDGAITAFGLLIFAAIAVLGGLALDVSNAIAARTQLQIAADIAAHAALYNRDTQDADAAKQAALDIAKSVMPEGRYGEILTIDDIHFGTFDPETRSFSIDESSTSAAMVETFRVSDRANSVGTFLLKLVGFTEWDLVTPSVFETYRRACLREGFVAEQRVEIQSNNIYTNGFCIHSNTYVSVNSGNFWEAGTVVSMPDDANLELPQSGFDTNDGLQAALREGRYTIRLLNRLDALVDGVQTQGTRYSRPWITNYTPKVLTGKKLVAADFDPGRIHRMSCSGGGQVMFEAGEVFEDIVLVGSNCDFKFGQGVQLIDATIITTSTDAKSINAPSGLKVGLDDSCAEGGGAQIVTYGGIDIAASLEMYGGQFLALGPIAFAAEANGIEGASMVSSSTIDGTSNMTMGFCGSGMTEAFEAFYFRMRA